MPYRAGDPTVDLEATIEVTTAKAYLIHPTMGSKKEIWLPKSQVVGISDPDENGQKIFTVTKWWADRAEVLDE
jgi:hypothetical protein